jgi:hypothetical protein
MTATNKWYSYPRVMLLVYLLSSKSSYQKLVFFPQTLEKTNGYYLGCRKNEVNFLVVVRHLIIIDQTQEVVNCL